MRAPCFRCRRTPPAHVSSEEISPDLRLRSPYRGIVTGRSILRLRVVIAPRGVPPHEVVVEVDDLAIEVRADERLHADGRGDDRGDGRGDDRGEGRTEGCDEGRRASLIVGAGAIDALFVVERQPRHGFLTWFGVFARRRGRADCLLLETPEDRVARFVERAIEDRLGLADEPVRGELRVAL
jgi:hypothetical protein